MADISSANNDQYNCHVANSFVNYEREKWMREGIEASNKHHSEFKWRTVAAGFWAMVFMTVPLASFVVISNFRIFGIFSFIQEVLWKIVSFDFVKSLINLQILCAMMAVMLHRYYKVRVIPCQTRWKEVAYVLHPQRLLWLISMTVLGFLCAVVFSSLMHDVILQDFCQHDESCFSTTRKSLYSFGGLKGLRYGICFFTKKFYVLSFPLIQEQRFFRARANLPSCMRNAVFDAIESIKIFYLVHGSFEICVTVIAFLITGQGISSSILPNTLAIFNISFLWLCAAMGFSISATMQITDCFCKVFLTQEYSFILKSDFLNDDRLLLRESLLSRDDLLRHLAFLDLCQVAKFDPKRRKQIFEITLPGGHPENWNLILSQCLGVIEDSANRFKTAHEEEMKRNQWNKNLSLQRQKTFCLTDKNRYQSMLSPSKNLGLTEDVAGEDMARADEITHESNAQTKKPHIKSFALSKLFDERDEFKSESLFQDNQMVIWTLEGLSSLVTASYLEDAYGVVQRTLPQIFVALFSFLEAVELYIKSSIRDERLPIHKLKEFQERKASSSVAQSYKLAVQTSIYKISVKFGANLESVRIPREFRKRLDAFLEFRE